MMKLLYKPFAIIAGLIASRIGRSAFRSIWSSIDEQPPPAPGSGRGGAGKVIAGQALQGAVMAGVSAGVHRVFASAFHHLVGAWPEQPPKPDED